mmetsp:Transcript_149948/g.481834  ORF Transcript_149948/g.481834 Transcript_149948/m.481834 type:complete len:417 (+) Transcript_149948:3652-4902(+)
MPGMTKASSGPKPTLLRISPALPPMSGPEKRETLAVNAFVALASLSFPVMPSFATCRLPTRLANLSSTTASAVPARMIWLTSFATLSMAAPPVKPAFAAFRKASAIFGSTTVHVLLQAAARRPLSKSTDPGILPVAVAIERPSSNVVNSPLSCSLTSKPSSRFAAAWELARAAKSAPKSSDDFATPKMSIRWKVGGSRAAKRWKAAAGKASSAMPKMRSAWMSFCCTAPMIFSNSMPVLLMLRISSLGFQMLASGCAFSRTAPMAFPERSRRSSFEARAPMAFSSGTHISPFIETLLNASARTLPWMASMARIKPSRAAVSKAFPEKSMSTTGLKPGALKASKSCDNCTPVNPHEGKCTFMSVPRRNIGRSCLKAASWMGRALRTKPRIPALFSMPTRIAAATAFSGSKPVASSSK